MFCSGQQRDVPRIITHVQTAIVHLNKPFLWWRSRRRRERHRRGSNEYPPHPTPCYQENLTVMQLSLTSVLLWTNALESFLCVGLLTSPMPTGLQGTYIHTVLADISRGTEAPVRIKPFLACAVVRTGVGRAVIRRKTSTPTRSVVINTRVNVDLFTAYKNTWIRKKWQIGVIDTPVWISFIISQYIFHSVMLLC